MRRKYFHQVGIAIDQLINTLLAGHADETLSARAWRMQNKKCRWKIACQLIDGLFFWQDNHCFKSHINELERRHMPDHYKNDTCK